MPTLFADSGYWIALLYSGDQLHRRATAVAENLNSTAIVTTQMVLAEALNNLSSRGGHLRGVAVQMIQDLTAAPNVEIILQTDEQFRAAMDVYAARQDQTWSLTDCASFLVMEERGITEALAYDRDFEQAGFVALLRHAQDS